MRLDFTKMQGLGNDFVVIDNRAGAFVPTPQAVRRIADRRLGVGCDQLLLMELPGTSGAHVKMRIFNADGGEVEQCGNGARCLCLYARDQGAATGERIDIETLGGVLACRIETGGEVSVDMGVPRLDPPSIPFHADAEALSYPLSIGDETVAVGAVSMGNPHAVVRVDTVAGAPVDELGPAIQKQSRFPDGANVGFMEVVARDHLRLRVYERGVGETLACGTGACAAVVVGRLQGALDERVAVDLPGGRLRVGWPGRDQPVHLSGPAIRVFEGIMTL